MGTKTIWILAMALVAVGCGEKAPGENPAEGAPQRVSMREETPAPSATEGDRSSQSAASSDATADSPSGGTTSPDTPVSSDHSAAGSGAIGSMPTSPPVSGTSEPSVGTGQTQQGTEPQAPPVSNLTDKYVIKTRTVGPGAMPEFRVTINGTDVAYTGQGDSEITSLFTKGKNEVKVAWEPSIEKTRNRSWYTELTLGMERGGKWSTIVKKQLPQTTAEKGASTYTVVAR
jgi:hypothetical protein